MECLFGEGHPLDPRAEWGPFLNGVRKPNPDNPKKRKVRNDTSFWFGFVFIE